uniref:NADH dehydrogenase subunit 4 n=1 Tax=Loimia medusa TaxID=167822 RepID=UPI0031F41D39
MLMTLLSASSLLPLLLCSKLFLWPVVSISLLLLTFFTLLVVFPYSLTFHTSSLFSFVDFLSAPLISLTLWISALMIIASYKILHNEKSPQLFLFMITGLNLILLTTFSQMNIFIFYFSFEASLLPTLFLILGWGYQPERLQASFYLMIYTVAASLPLLISILLIFNINSSASFINFIWSPICSLPLLWWFFTLFAFLVKLPLYIVHLWLPKAHVEAPVAGSMILAAVLLKLGGYGILRMSSLYLSTNHFFLPFICSTAMWGAVITSLICIRQPDMKSLIAYSSVGHMGLLVAGLMSNSAWGWEGAMMMMIAHGFSSSALFALANSLYETSSTRSLFLTKGMLSFFPLMAMLWFLFSAANMAAPPTLNLAAEILLITSILSSSLYMMPLIALTSFLAAVYSLFLYTSTQHGSPMNYSNPLNLFNQRNLTLFLFHLIPLFLLILKPDVFIQWVFF